MTATTQTKTQRAVTEIRSRILNRELRPGEPLRQSALASEMKLGVTPVREALLQLASEGLVKKIPYVGVVVADMTPDSTHHIYETRRVLESYAAHQGCLKATHETIRRLRAQLEQMDAACAARDRERYQRHNQIFHMTIYEASGNPVLTELIAAQWRTFPRDTLDLFEHRMDQSLREHYRLMEAFERRDAANVQAMMAAHIAGVEYDVSAYIARREDGAVAEAGAGQMDDAGGVR
ncbi:MAG TPA: GntR family transcriptional regulator [Devosiaceae bacterium]|jgi:DNA-binding GntR family transcriptional regulator|nr:GntR family transcriptional regulator [Devosiaceae bacterium]